MTQIYTRPIPEQVIPGRRLGRHVRHDSRSLAFQVKPRASLTKSIVWTRQTAVLDQGDLGSCTGNAACGALGTDPFWTSLQADLQVGLKLDEDEAVRLYSAATKLDSYTGTYPPTDSGSDGLSVAKACKNAGWISGYVHATSLDAAVTALQAGCVITGVNWYDSFDSPDASGHVVISKDAQVRGGHEFELVGVDVEAKTLRAVNSWGDGWGDRGYFTLQYADFDRLLHEDGDVTQFVPITSPAPTPTPIPTPGGVVKTFTASAAAALDDWSGAPHWWSKATRGAKAWKSAT